VDEATSTQVFARPDLSHGGKTKEGLRKKESILTLVEFTRNLMEQSDF
jgi:hypothetical protein